RSGDQHIRLKPDQIHRVGTQAFGLAARQAVLDPNIAARDPTQLLEPFVERGHTRLDLRIANGCSDQHADQWYAISLGARGEWPGSHPHNTNACDELAPSHSITSSAIAIMPEGMARPSAFA